MAITITMYDNTTYIGVARHFQGDVAFDASYPTGGYAFTPREFKLGRIDRLNVQPHAGYLFDTGPAGTTIRVFHGDNNAVTAGPFVEVPNGTDLSTLFTFYEAWGS